MSALAAAALHVELSHLAQDFQQKREALAEQWVQDDASLSEESRASRAEQYVGENIALLRQHREAADALVRDFYQRHDLSVADAGAARLRSAEAQRLDLHKYGVPVRRRGGRHKVTSPPL